MITLQLFGGMADTSLDTKVVFPEPVVPRTAICMEVSFARSI
jgi:hypothetical protein